VQGDEIGRHGSIALGKVRLRLDQIPLARLPRRPSLSNDGDSRDVGTPARGLDRLLDRDRGGHRVGRTGKGRHDAVAEIVVERAVMQGDGLGKRRWCVCRRASARSSSSWMRQVVDPTSR
jgi:hypothetical protein